MKNAWCVPLMAAFTCQAYAASASLPAPNATKRDAVRVHANSPADIRLKLYVTWQATSEDPICWKIVGFGVTAPNEMDIPIEPSPTSRKPQNWTVFRDAFAPGRCGWMMKSIDVFADRAGSRLKIDRAANISNRVAYVLSPFETHDEYSWAVNDSPDKPVHLFCDFAQLRAIDRSKPPSVRISVNPCDQGWEKYHGTDMGKGEHILAPDQHRVTFTIDNYR